MPTDPSAAGAAGVRPPAARIEKMVPTEPPTSRFDEPSTGSHATTTARGPVPSGISMGSGASSEMKAEHACERRSARAMASWAQMSSGFCSSPEKFLPPVVPVSPRKVAKASSRAMSRDMFAMARITATTLAAYSGAGPCSFARCSARFTIRCYAMADGGVNGA